MPKERLDKWIAASTTYSRKAVKALLREKRVCVNGIPVTDGAEKIDPTADAIVLDGKLFAAAAHSYLMLNKPLGVVSASRGVQGERTVVDLVPPHLQRKGLFPAGRLDKDTTGFVLLTDDGEFAHRILSPRHHIQKTYIASLACAVAESELEILRSGIQLRDGTQLLPAKLCVLDAARRTVEISICEGKYHQIKRMFGAVGNRVVALHRTKMGDLPLDPALAPGACRLLTAEELCAIEKVL